MPPKFEQLTRLTKQRQVIDETLRLHPPLWFISRMAKTDTSIAGYHIPEKSIVIIAPYTTHRHPDFWENPQTFQPSRFAEGNTNKKHSHAYFPFLGGRHICIGNQFAMMKIQIILSMMLQRFKIEPVSDSSGIAEPGSTLRMKDSLLITATKRQGA